MKALTIAAIAALSIAAAACHDRDHVGPPVGNEALVNVVDDCPNGEPRDPRQPCR